VVPVSAEDLPVRLPEDVAFDRPGNPLDRHPAWKHVACPICGERPRAKPTPWTRSSTRPGYYARFTDPWIDAPTDRPMLDAWLPVDQYIGGIEHAIRICSIRVSSPAP